MRIIAGEFRGRKLVAPKGGNTRPTPDRVREALFMILGAEVEGARVVELFGGTGSLGLESLSRGASHAVFYEVDTAARRCLERNVATLDVADRVTIRARSAFTLARRDAADPPYDLVFCDPPHRLLAEAESRRRIERLLSSLPLSSGALLLLEHPAGRLGDFGPEGLAPGEVRRWGSSGVAFFRAEDARS